jgi:hypothetical protein
MRESEVYQKVKQRLPRFSVDRIENSIASGMPDCVITHATSMIWSELKVQSHANILDDVRNSQLAWMYLKCKAGLSHKVCIISGHERKMTLDIWRVRLDVERLPTARNGIIVEHWCDFKLAGRLGNDTSFADSLLQLMHLEPEV